MLLARLPRLFSGAAVGHVWRSSIRHSCAPSCARRCSLAVLVPAIAVAQRGDSIIAIVGGTLIDGNGGSPLPNATILVRGGRITTVAAGSPAPRGARVINAAGKYIVPGFVDATVHVSIYSGLENFARYEDRFTDVVIEARRPTFSC